MDAYGNLTSIDEFSGNKRIRLISYLDPDVALGVFPPTPDSSGWSVAAVHRLSAGSGGQTLMRVNALGRSAFSLAWDGDTSQYLSWEGTASDQLVLEQLTQPQDGDHIAPPEFAVDFVEQCWFALNDPYHGAVVDISESGTGEGNPVISFSWNGGANQIWRAQWVDHPAAAADDGEQRFVQNAGKFAGQCQP